MDDNIGSPKANEFLDTIMSSRLEEFAHKLRADIIKVVNRNIDIFSLVGNPQGALFMRTGIEFSYLIGDIASMCAIKMEGSTNPRSEAILAQQAAILNLFQACTKAKGDIIIEKHLKQSN